MKPKSFEMLVFSTLKCQNSSLEFPRKVKCNILPNEPLVHCCCSLLGLIQILLNNHKFHKCETSAQNCSVLFINQQVIFLKKKSTIHKISQAHKTPSFHLFFLAVIAARSRPPLMNARMCVFPAARCLKNWEWCNKGTNRRQREAEAIRGCRKDIWLDWIPTAATLQRAALQTVLF